MTGGRRPELDGLRGVAILLVLGAHARIYGMAGGGVAGVTLFFVLSGYLITGLLRSELERTGRVSLRAFYERRARRLLPALIALLLVCGLAMASIGRIGEYVPQATTTLLYVANLWQSIGHGDVGLLTGVWSLSVEEQFYLAWPAVFIILRGDRRLVWLLFAGIVASMVSRLVSPQTLNLALRTDIRADAILWGCLLAFVPLRMSRMAVIVAGAILALVTVMEPDSFVIGLTAAAVSSAVLVASAKPGVLTWRPLVRTGQLSYGLYLWHLPILRMLGPSLDDQAWWAPIVIIVGGFALALVSEWWIERPWRFRSHPVPDDPVREVRFAHERAGQPGGL